MASSPKPSPLLLAAAGAWTLAVGAAHTWQCLAFFSPYKNELLRHAFFPWTGRALPLWAGHAASALGVGLFLGSAFLLGRRLWERGLLKGRPEAASWELRFLQTGLGLILWSLAGLFLAVAGFSKPWVLRAFSLGLVGTLFFLDRKEIRQQLLTGKNSVGRFLQNPGRAFLSLGLPGTLLAVFSVFYGAAALLPEIFGDPLHAVLAVPESSLRLGRLADLPGLCSTRFPGFMGMLYLWPLAWGSDPLCKLLNLGFTGLWAGLVGAWAGRRWGRPAGLWSALLLTASPLVGGYIWSATAEILCGFFIFLAFDLWNGAWEKNEPRLRSQRLFLAGLFLGSAAAAKYVAVLAFPYFALDLLLRLVRKKDPWPRGLWLAGAGVLLPLLPWWALNFLREGNPFYPYAAAWFGNTDPAQQDLFEFLVRDQRGDLSFGGRLGVLLTQSVKGVWSGRQGFLGPTLLAALPFLGVLAGKGSNGKALRSDVARLALFAGASWLAFAGTTGLLRFLIPCLGIFFAAAGAVVARLSQRGRAYGFLAGALVLTQLASLAGIFQCFFHGWDVVSGRVSAAQYLRSPHGTAHRSPPQGAYDFLAESSPAPGNKVYIIGETSGYRCPVDWYANTLYDVPLYARWFREGLSTEEFLERLRQEGFTYVLVNHGGFQAAVAAPYRAPEWLDRLFQALDRMAPPVYQDSWTLLFRVPEGPAPTPQSKTTVLLP